MSHHHRPCPICNNHLTQHDADGWCCQRCDFGPISADDLADETMRTAKCQQHLQTIARRIIEGAKAHDVVIWIGHGTVTSAASGFGPDDRRVLDHALNHHR